MTEDVMGHTFVKDIMKKAVVSVDSSLSVRDTAKMITDAGVGCAVVTENNLSIGIVTERDFVRKIVATERPLSTPVKDIMSSPLIVINSDETVWELAELMKQRRIHKVPVIDQDKLVGIVTSTDLTKLCSIGSDSEMRKICDQILLRMKPN